MAAIAFVVPYQYHSLQRPGSVRIPQLAPSATVDVPIHCTLGAHQLSDPNLQFESLSYTWGDAFDVVTISIGDDQASLSGFRTVIYLAEANHGTGLLFDELEEAVSIPNKPTPTAFMM
ncbi:hypothetical protein B0T18DRAFT_392956 [Schizothecium vesticola]|uniref:Heterokaryon incompatibility domain-containing protein n=1 Tax=Schizothecium vesticola TaxID=314040 RepID=A0AA40EFU0_9PEZI|nr:hypothetical protein B0T18DRAFT_392956 [Schizothecium vesticola]